MNLHNIIEKEVKLIVLKEYQAELQFVETQITKKEFAGDITVVLFPMLRFAKTNPEELGNLIGSALSENVEHMKAYNVVKGFLNLEIAESYYLNLFNNIKGNGNFGFVKTKEKNNAIIVEYSSPNTNKPLHLGHIRNIVLGDSVARIKKASGRTVYKTQIINDRGIHICKSMLAWQRFGNGETPEISGLKGDKLVGKYYVKFDQEYKKQINELVLKGIAEDEAKKNAPILLDAQQMLQDWENGKQDVVALWKTMNHWVYDGMDATYSSLDVDFDKNYYESQTYLLGKEFIEQGLKKGVFFRKEDNSVWCDLTNEGLDEKIVLRADGTSVYITQDIGTAIQRIKDYPNANEMIYTVGNEQDYHFKVLFVILNKLGFSWAENLFHLSYGMVDLPSGKMKSREGTVVDADDILQEMADTAKNIATEKGKLDGFSNEEKEEIYKIIGYGALKYQILKVDPKKRILFDPQESIDFNGDSGPFIQMIYVRTRAILRKANFNFSKKVSKINLHEKEKELIKLILIFSDQIQLSAKQNNPTLIVNYLYNIAKEYSSYYQAVPILGELDDDTKIFRVQLSNVVGITIKNALSLLGVKTPERM